MVEVKEATEIDNEVTEIDEDSIIFDEIDPEKELNLNKRIPDDERTSLPYLTKYEKVNLIGTRAKQISDGSDIYVISKNAKNAVDISKLELEGVDKEEENGGRSSKEGSSMNDVDILVEEVGKVI